MIIREVAISLLISVNSIITDTIGNLKSLKFKNGMADSTKAIVIR